jgi:glycerophosphoryl diester phosphodiesterase
MAEGLGANGVEIDVRLTRDGIPIIYHDENLNPRLVKGEFCIGPIANYTFAHLRTLCTLKNNEQIPTLAEALETVVMKTSLSVVWLDIKSEEAIASVIQLQRQYLQLAASVGRTVELLIGLPSLNAVEKYLADSSHGTAPAICELDVADVRRANAAVWAPAWTLGPMLQKVTEMHNEGRRVFFWTLDGAEFIKVFLDQSMPDGMVTNYPSIIAYEYYVR